MAPTKTAAKGRARAGRASDAAAAPTVESPPAASADETPKRRGRPAKSDGGSSGKVKKAYVPTGRPRGRPANPNTKPKAPYVPTGRPRGRPVGSGKKAKAAAGARAAVARAGKKGASVARGGPKGRKSDAAKAKEDEELGEDVDMEDDDQADDNNEQLSDEDGGE